jgi:hypothetical protein
LSKFRVRSSFEVKREERTYKLKTENGDSDADDGRNVLGEEPKLVSFIVQNAERTQLTQTSACAF